MYNIDLTPIIQAAIVLLATIITCKLVPWIKAKTTSEQQSYLTAVVKTLVYAAEQIYGSGMGQEKMDYVIDHLHNRGLTVDLAQIEAAVRENFGHMMQGDAGEGEDEDEPVLDCTGSDDPDEDLEKLTDDNAQ